MYIIAVKYNSKTTKVNSMKKLLASAVLLFALFTSVHAATKSPMSITDIKGKTYNVQDTKNGLKIKGLEGKIVFLEFFGHKCPPCLKSIPHLNNLQKKHKDTLAIVAIEVQGLNNNRLKQFAKEKRINYIVAADSEVDGVTSYVDRRSSWQGSIPFLVILDQKGDVQYAAPGALPEADLENFIQQLISKK